MLKKSILLITVFMLSLLWGCKDNGTNSKPDPLELSSEIKHVNENGEANGSISLTVTGGTEPYEFSWSTGVSNQDISNLSAGIYKVTVTDADGESKIDSMEITEPDPGFLRDIDGNLYSIVKIGNQSWIAENLRVTHSPNRSPVSSCYYGDDENNLQTYGRLYTWNAAMNNSTTEGAQGIAPDGWHIPSVSDWETLITHLGGEAIAGGKMKETGTSHWNTPNNASNSSGMRILAAGEKDGTYKFLGEYAVIWTSKQVGASQANYYTLKNNELQIVQRKWNKNLSYAVRCVKDN